MSNRLNFLENKTKKPKGRLLGVGLDNKDGHKRLTRAEQFSVVGGSQETHESMSETLVKTCEDLKRVGRDVDTAESQEIVDLIAKHSQR